MLSNALVRSAFDSLRAETVCLRCLRKAAKAERDHRRAISNASLHPTRVRSRWKPSVSAHEYFWPSTALAVPLYPHQASRTPTTDTGTVDDSLSTGHYFEPNFNDWLSYLRLLGGRQLSAAGSTSEHVAATGFPARDHDRLDATSLGSSTAKAAYAPSPEPHTPGNTLQDGGRVTNIAATQPLRKAEAGVQSQSLPMAVEETLPHRRRRRSRHEEAASSATTTQSATPESYVIPPDASSRLTTASAAAPASSWRRQLGIYLSLSKPRLTFLIVLTTAAPYCIYPTPDLLSPVITSTPSLSALTLLFLTTGTALSSASANTFNMLFEPKYDAQMSRTRNRPLVRKLISPRAAAIFGVLTGLAGVAALYFGCNPTTSFLGAANILLYAGVYTPMKRLSVANTWVGALVGALPPLMGWTAAAGQYAADGTWRELLFTDQALGGWLLAALLFAWQFPHFNALSHTIRHEYAAAGYKMLCSVNPARNARVAVRYSLLMFPICYALAACGIVGGGGVTAPTTLLWAVGSTATNGWMSYQAVRFWRWQGGKGSARALFWASVWHLPVLLVLAMALKRGIWQRVAESLGLGAPDDDVDEDLAVLEDAAALVQNDRDTAER